MARLPYLGEKDLAGDDKDIVKRGMNLHRILAHSLVVARRYSGPGRYKRFERALDPRLRELAILQVGYLAKSPNDYSHHLRLGREVGVTDDDVKAIEDATTGNDSGPPDLDRAVLRAGDVRGDESQRRDRRDTACPSGRGGYHRLGDGHCIL